MKAVPKAGQPRSPMNGHRSGAAWGCHGWCQDTATKVHSSAVMAYGSAMEIVIHAYLCKVAAELRFYKMQNLNRGICCWSRKPTYFVRLRVRHATAAGLVLCRYSATLLPPPLVLLFTITQENLPGRGMIAPLTSLWNAILLELATYGSYSCFLP